MIRELCRVGYGCMIVNYRPNELLSENNYCQKIIIVRKIIIVHGTIIRVLHYNVKVTATGSYSSVLGVDAVSQDSVFHEMLSHEMLSHEVLSHEMFSR